MRMGVSVSVSVCVCVCVWVCVCARERDRERGGRGVRARSKWSVFRVDCSIDLLLGRVRIIRVQNVSAPGWSCTAVDKTRPWYHRNKIVPGDVDGFGDNIGLTLPCR